MNRNKFRFTNQIKFAMKMKMKRGLVCSTLRNNSGDIAFYLMSPFL